MNYPISDMLIRIKNAQAVGKEHVVVPFSGTKLRILEIFKEVGFIHDFEKRTKKGPKSEHAYLLVALKYEDKKGAISDFKIISKPSRHMYIKAREIKLVHSGYGIAVISTSKGILSSKEAFKKGLGGEILFEIW